MWTVRLSSWARSMSDWGRYRCGNLGAFVNGSRFAGLFGSTVGVKLGEADRQELAASGAGPFGPSQRPMGGYLALPGAVVDQPDEAAAWIHRALDHVTALPAKKPEAPKAVR